MKPAAVRSSLAAALALALVLAGATLEARAPIVSKASKSSKASRASKASKGPLARGLAPEIKLSRWINSKPLTPADLSGKPRLVEFWTFDGADCRNTVMAMREIHGLYAKRGLHVLGIHAPELPHERDSTAVAAAVKEQGIAFPVGLDNDHAVFKAFRNRYRPALYLIDRKGVIRSVHIGELQVGTRAWNNFCAAIESTLVAAPPRRRS